MTDHVSTRNDGEILDSTPQQEPSTGEEGQPSAHSQRYGRARRPASLDVSREDALRRLTILGRLTRLLQEGNHDVDRLLQGLARLCSEQVGDMCTVTMLNMHGDIYHMAAYYDPDPEIVALFQKTLADIDPIRTSQGWAASVVATGEPVLVPTISTEDANKTAAPALREFASRVGIASILIVPISGRSGTLGTIGMTRHSGGRPYTEGNRDLLMEVGRRVGLAIESGMLVESLRQEVAGYQFATDALAASEQRFLSIFHAAAMGIQVMNLVGNILESNAAFQAMTGYSEGDLVAMQFYDLVHAADLAAVLHAFRRVKSAKDPVAQLDYRLCAKDGSIVWVRSTFAGVKRTADDAALALIFGIVEDITTRKKADVELMELRQHLQHSIELERLHLAQNLHDTPLQELYAVIYKLEELRPNTRPATSEIIGQIIDDIKHTLEGLRSTASELRPPALSRFGLEKAIRSHMEDFRQKYPGIKLSLALAKDHQLLAEDLRLVLFRVFQEAMTNIARHSQATEVHVRFSFDAEEARIEITDNGRGFDVPENWMVMAREGHYGLAGMAERVQAAGGVLSLSSRPSGPTIVRAIIPC